MANVYRRVLRVKNATVRGIVAKFDDGSKEIVNSQALAPIDQPLQRMTVRYANSEEGKSDRNTQAVPISEQWHSVKFTTRTAELINSMAIPPSSAGSSVHGRPRSKNEQRASARVEWDSGDEQEM
jgi:hypothetical protein